MRTSLPKLGIVSAMILAAALVFAASCGEVQNADNFAVITGRVLNSVDDPTGVEGVVVWVESDPNSDAAYLGGDVYVTTDRDGVYEANVFLGYLTIRDRPEEGDGGVGGGTFSVDFPQFVGDARVIMYYQDQVLDLGGGFTIQRGRTMDVWDVYLSEFAPYSGGGGEIVGTGSESAR